MKLKQIFFLLFTAFGFINDIKSVPKLMIKIPTRSRPEQFFNVLNAYYNNLSGQVPCFFLITCDQDDTSMNNERVLNKLRMYPNLHIHFSRNKSKIEAYNRDIDTHFDFDVLLVTSDDAYPVVRGYDKIIVDAMEKNFPDFDGVLNFNDGYAGDLNTLPIIGKKYYNRFKYIYHPDYRSLYCDNELTVVSRMLGKEVIFNDIIIRHEHPANNPKVGYDKLYIENDKWVNRDLEIFRARREHNFFVPQKNINSGIKLSILICTLEERKNLFNRIHNKLNNQIKNFGLENKVEVLYLSDNRENPVGYKRNQLLQRSRGEYICFVDDDDDVHDSYIKLIYDKLQSNPDCVSLKGIITTNGQNPRYFIHSIQFKSWFEQNGVYYRPPNHLNPIKRSIAIQFAFPLINYGEDAKWSMAISNSGMLRKEEVIDVPYYFYLYTVK